MVRIPQATLYNGMVGYKGTWYRRKFGAGYNPRSKMAMGKGMVQKKRKAQVGPIGKMGPRVQFTIPPKN